MRRVHLSSTVIMIVLAGNLSAAAWSQVPDCCGAWAQASAKGPSARSNTGLAYDADRGRVVLFGGQAGSAVFGDTWEWDGASWRQVATAGPGPRAGHAMVFDGIRHRVLLFGGYDDKFTGRDGTWEWDGTTWTQVAATGPSSRNYPAMAFDSGRGRVVLFGGQTVHPIGDTWEWDGTGWTQVASTGPAARTEAAMAYDAARGRVVLFGGQPVAGGWLGDTWEWNGAAWTQAASTGPSARADAAMVFAGSCSQVLLFGGAGATGYDGDLWGWNGSTWTLQAATGPAARSIHAMAFDGGRRRVVLFGGQASNVTEGDTWELAAAPLVVTNDLDSGAGSLRDAIAAACDGGTITFAPGVASPITLAKQLSIERSLTIEGPGAGSLTLSGNHTVRVFAIGLLTAGINVTLSGLTIADGRVQVTSSDQAEGGGIFSGASTLTLDHCTLSGNSVGGGIQGFGGCIFVESGTMNVVDSVLSGNSASSFGGGGGGSDGGCIFNFRGAVNIVRSTLSGNSVNGVGGVGFGGAIYNDLTGPVNIVNSTLSGNTASGNAAFGGAIDNGQGTLTVTNSTLYGNVASGCDFLGCVAYGGAIYTEGGPGSATILDSTIAGNRAMAYYGFSGGIYNGGARIMVGNTIVAGNTASGVLVRGPDVYNGFDSLGYNLIGVTDGGSGFDAAKHDLLGTGAAPLDPRLDPSGLQDNGGPTRTLALLAGSPAIDHGGPAKDPVTQLPLATDQRGFLRPIDDPGTPDPPYGNLSDIGAYEFLSGGQPAIGALDLTLAQGSVVAHARIGQVSDPSQGSDTLTVTATPVAGSGVTVSNITLDAGGQVFGDLAASCTATSSSFTLTVLSSNHLSATATWTVTVSADTPPVLGSYPPAVGPINPGASVIVPPSGAPSDGGPFGLTASAPGFGGVIGVATSTGVVTIGNARPPGAYTVTLEATDACGLSSSRSFALLVNHPPTIVGQALGLRQGALPGAPVRIATVGDVEDPKGALRVAVNGGPSATVNGVTLSQVTVGPAGAVRANAAAACGAASAVLTLTVTDSGGLSASAPLTVAVFPNQPPLLGDYPPARVRRGTTALVAPNAPPADDGAIVSLTATATGSFGGGLEVDRATGAVTVFNAGPVGSYRILVTARDNCGVATVRSFTLNVSPF